MKKNNYFTQIILLFVLALSFSACSKDKEDDNGLSGNSGMTMKVDGVAWKSAMTTLFAEKHGDDVDGIHVLYINGTRIIEKNSATEDDLAESLGLYINIPASKFRNPNGTYPIIKSTEMMNQAWGIFSTSTDIRDAAMYVSGDPQDVDKIVGTLEISGFEIGMQNIVGQPTGVEGYTKLSGNFQLDVYPIVGEGTKLKLTEGKFNLSAGIGFNF